MRHLLKERLSGTKGLLCARKPFDSFRQSERGASATVNCVVRAHQAQPSTRPECALGQQSACSETAPQQPGQGASCGVQARATEPTGWPPPQTATGPLPWQVESKASGGTLIVRDNYLRSYLRMPRGQSFTEMSVNVHHIYRTCCTFPKQHAVMDSNTYKNHRIQHTHPPPAHVPQLRWSQDPGPSRQPAPPSPRRARRGAGLGDTALGMLMLGLQLKKKGRLLLTTKPLNKGS